MRQDIFDSLKLIWDYLTLHQELEHSDCILVFGGHDPSVAIHAAKLYKEKWAGKIIISGGVVHDPKYYGLSTEMIEADALKTIVISNGVLDEDIILERHAKNTSENFWNIAKLIDENNLDYNKFIIVQKPYTERRTYATALKRWPNKKTLISSIDISFEEYLQSGIPTEKIINMMVGEVERIKEYPEKGYMVYQDVPDYVLKAYNLVKDEGYNERQIKE